MASNYGREIRYHSGLAHPGRRKDRVAQKLFELGYFDDATSRAYYGMFYAAKAVLLSADVDTRSHGRDFESCLNLASLFYYQR